MTAAPEGEPSGPATTPQHVHPASVVIFALRWVPVVAVLYLVLADDDVRGTAGWIVAGLGVAFLVGLAAAYLTWRNLTYFFDDSGDFRVDSGVLTRRQRRLTLSRLQSVDVVRPVLARMFGMASVRVEVAGSGDSNGVVEYLPLEQATQLRAEVLARAAGVGSGAPEAPEEVAVRIDSGTLVTSLLLRGGTVVAVLVTALGIAGVLVFAGPAGFLLVGFGVFVPALSVIAEFTTYYQFTLARSPDGLRIRSGALRTVAQTVPPGRVHAVELKQPFLWRRQDWVRVSLNIAGTSTADGQNAAAPKVLLPVATTQQAQELLAELLPDWDISGVVLRNASPKARWRSPIQHRHLGFGRDEHILVTTRGRFVRRTAAIAHARVQSVRLTQGPWQRRLGLASAQADSVPGPVQVVALNLDAEAAREAVDHEIEAMHAAAQGNDPARWMQAPLPSPHRDAADGQPDLGGSGA